jgi:hypothetical protein
MAEKREKRKVPKRSAGLVISPPQPRPVGDDPSLDLFREAKAAQEGETTTHHPPPTYLPPPTTQPVAPERDFSRVPNSVARVAIPSGLYKGESKKTYDALFHRTRGAVAPRRSVRATLAEVMDWAGVSHNTLKAHLKHLSKVGLVKVHYVRGDNTGADYEVFFPEERTPPTTHHPPPNLAPPTTQNLGPPTTQNLVLGGGGQVVEESTTSGDPKTSFKTNTERSDDDEAFAGLLVLLRQAAKEITGREPDGADFERWRELGDVLVTELRIAAGRTTVSSVPAFLAEHLRRRLFKKDKRQIDTEARSEGQAPESGVETDASQCPDCFGAGMWYPEGYEKGVAKCRHDKLTAASRTQ